MDKQALRVNEQGHLVLGGVDATRLVQAYGTPLVVYDVAVIRQQIQEFQSALRHSGLRYQISYASKAFAAVAMYQVIDEEGLHADVVSGGELYTALQAGFPASNLSFHGNNKSLAELEMAVENHVGVIVLDNFHEIDLLRRVLLAHKTSCNVMLRLTPGITAHTHRYIQTGQVDSKFGFDVDSGQATRAVQEVLAIPQMTIIGIHAHIGSQIFGVTGFELLVKKLMALSAQWRDQLDFTPGILNLGGGFGIAYTAADDPLTPADFIQHIAMALREAADQHQVALPEIWIEPGRAIVGPAGYNLYSVGSRKDIPNLTPYLSVDGGMGDNIRPALYHAKYAAVLANKMDAPTQETVHLAGKYCESGDVLVDHLALPRSEPGDLIAMLDTGAYGYSMASNYNRNPRPAVIFVEDGLAKVVVRRETYADLVRLDARYE
ncbi:diaminopimelate decarboxylase [Levilactobacillus fujinensis]|uniref:Diaminopimelate decarboxylase n=1 Tax=Levilactobacillus fujinensis TaxID=2486024 RepID=A0ABW1TC95_9LACO|nr:diaminopimelate decarboxylase [Levilactobacillus fujinensis]